MELETAVRKYLLASPAVVGYVGVRVYKFRLEGPLTGSASRALVVRRVGGWTAPDQVQTREFPLLQVECWADPDRDERGNVLVANGPDKAFALYRVVDPLLHTVRGVDLSDLQVVSSQRWSEPILITQDDSHGDLVLGDSVKVVTRYAMSVVH